MRANYKKIALIGRPNVGKSTLFNRLTHGRALVDNRPGITRDRRTDVVILNDIPVELIDTAGFLDSDDDTLQTQMNEQSELAMSIADAIWLIVDASAGPQELDRAIWLKIQERNIPCLLLVNKMDTLAHQEEAAPFFQIHEHYQLISATTKKGMAQIKSWVAKQFQSEELSLEDTAAEKDVPQLAILGRPNAGKSTLCNILAGENRVIVSNEAGTTRDCIAIPIRINDTPFKLIDTAGVRRKSRISIKLEQQMVWQALESLKRAAVTVIVVDATTGLTDQDMRLMQHIWNSGSGMIIALNKCDSLSKEQAIQIEENIERYTQQWDGVPIIRTSFKYQKGVSTLKKNIFKVLSSFGVKPKSSFLTKILERAVQKTPPPLSSHKTRVKLRFAFPVGYTPLVIKIRGKQLKGLPGSYKSYLSRQFRKQLNITGIPIKLIFESDSNPYSS